MSTLPLKSIRLWGELPWLLPKLKIEQWGVLGTVSVEDRCLATPSQFKPSDIQSHFVVIRDPDPIDKAQFDARINHQKSKFRELGFSDQCFREASLMADLDFMKNIATALLDDGAQNIVVDISSMPKRWFFAILKFLIADVRTQSLIVTYSSPEQYGEILAENPSPIVMLPGFPGEGEQDYDSVIIGIGFEPLGLTNLVKDLKLKRIRLLFPFPPGPPGFNKNWMFVKQIEDMTRTQSIDPPDKQSAHMFDCPQIFDILCEMTESAEVSSVMTPYGPKPMSLAMCLFSLAAAAKKRPLVPIYYAQPQRYALDYSTGIRQRDGVPTIMAYSVKMRGSSLYEL